MTPKITGYRRGDILAGKNDTYSLVKQLGEGAVGHVWSATSKSLGPIAVKILNPRPDLLDTANFPNVKKRFQREASNGSKLSHPSLIHILDQGDYRNAPFIVMEIAERSVDAILKAVGAFALDDAFPIIRACVDSLAYIHASHLIHRDVKPANVLKCDRGYVLADFGIIKWTDFNPAFTSAATITARSVQLGSWNYMAPEQQADPHEAVPESDVYALGVSWC